MPTATWNLEESAGKALARRTGIAYEASVLGEKQYISKPQYLHRKYGDRWGMYKCIKVATSYPGRSVTLPCATSMRGGGMGCHKSRETILGLSIALKVRYGMG